MTNIERIEKFIQEDFDRQYRIDAVRLKRIRKRAGRCYELAHWGLMQASDHGLSDHFVLVHGEINGPPDLAPRTGHAWLESKVDPIVYDAVKDKTMPIDDYYRLLNPTNTTKYAVREAANMAVKTGHYGPWSED